MSKTPKRPGLYWATLDNGNGQVEIALLRVGYYSGLISFEQGILCEFVDGSKRHFDLANFGQTLAQPWTEPFVASAGITHFEHVKITWHGEAKPPRSARMTMPVKSID
ncbi:hypothetical protein [Bosea massiliensis]|uniref:DUF2442 domain-containing protein n=1 Tax=Bosea massiliensis TaxID=151419 RepID=A0ABW0P0W3_9HYPH